MSVVNKDSLNPIMFVEGFDLDSAPPYVAPKPGGKDTKPNAKSSAVGSRLPRSVGTNPTKTLSASAAETKPETKVVGSQPEATLAVPFRKTLGATSSVSKSTASKKNAKNKNNDLSFTVSNILSLSECKYIIKTAIPLLAGMENMYNTDVREAKRAMISSPKVAGQLYKRILPHLKREDYLDRTPMCFGQDGVWVPYGLNECLKVFKYEPGGRFAPHRDGPWLPQPDRGSMFTVVIYLNESVRGGSTILYGSEGPPEPSASSLEVVPALGTALLFNHEQWHAGETVMSGAKWYMRTELIFMRVHSFYVDRDAFATSEEYLAMKALYNESQQAAVDGDKDSFFTKYQEVVRQQREAMLNDARARKERLLPTLGLEELSVILSFLPHASVNQLLRVNRRTFTAVVQAPYWQDLFEGRVHQPIPVLQTPTVLPNATLPISAEPSTTDYFTLVRQRLRMLKFFAPVGLLCLDSGYALVGMFSIDGVSKGEAVVGMRGTSYPNLGGLSCIYTKKRFEPAEYNHYSTPLYFTDDDRYDDLYDEDKMPVPEPFAELFANGFPHVRSIDSPMVVVPPVDWWASEGFPISDKIGVLGLGLLDGLRIPAIAMIHPAVCAALGLRRLSPSAIREGTVRLHLVLESSEGRFLVDMVTFEATFVTTIDNAIVLRDAICEPPEFSLREVLAAGYLELTQNPRFPQQLFYRC